MSGAACREPITPTMPHIERLFSCVMFRNAGGVPALREPEVVHCTRTAKGGETDVVEHERAACAVADRHIRADLRGMVQYARAVGQRRIEMEVDDVVRRAARGEVGDYVAAEDAVEREGVRSGSA